MNTLKINTFDFAGNIQRNITEYLKAAITFHYDGFDGDVSELSDKDLKYDASNIVDNLIGEPESVEYPDGSVYSREELEEAIVEQIKETY